MSEQEQDDIESYRYQVRQWNKLVREYLPETNCDRDDIEAVGSLIESLRSELYIVKEQLSMCKLEKRHVQHDRK